MAVAYAIVVAIVIYACANGLIGLFLSLEDTEAIELARTYLTCMCPMEWSLATLMIYRSALEGLRDGLTPMIGSVLEVVMRIIVSVWLCPIIGYAGACLSEPAAWVASAALMFPVFQIRLRKQTKLNKSIPVA